ncbi:MAG: DUF4062 domain-containing protein [Planctomycetota bacterium]
MPKLFLSSVVKGMEAMRDAAEFACAGLQLDCLRSEELPAAPTAPQGSCLRLVREADAVILLLGARYGDRQPSGVSATEEEFDEAMRLGRPVFPFVTAADLEPDQLRFRQKVEGNWKEGLTRVVCSNPAELQRDVTRALRNWTAGPRPEQVDEIVKTNLTRVVPTVSRHSFAPGGPWMAVSWAPNHALHMADDMAFQALPRLASDLVVAGDHRLADRRPQLLEEQDGVMLVVLDDGRTASLSAWLGVDASIAVGAEIPRGSSATGHSHDMNAMMHATMFLRPQVARETLGKLLAFVRTLVEHMDPTRVALSGRLQCSLSRMGMCHLADPVGLGQSVPIPLASLGGDHDRAVLWPKAPEVVVRPHLGLRQANEAA